MLLFNRVWVGVRVKNATNNKKRRSEKHVQDLFARSSVHSPGKSFLPPPCRVSFNDPQLQLKVPLTDPNTPD